MTDEILYMGGVTLACFAVNFLLRALPFLLFGNRGSLPAWVATFGEAISPVIITGLVIYSFSGLEWRHAAPYAAGALTVALQLWKRNALVSILAGTVLYMVLVGGWMA